MDLLDHLKAYVADKGNTRRVCVLGTLSACTGLVVGGILPDTVSVLLGLAGIGATFLYVERASS